MSYSVIMRYMEPFDTYRISDYSRLGNHITETNYSMNDGILYS